MFKKEYLTNDLPVVIESLRNMRSVVIGIWVKVGSRNELPERSGISHFLEHMFFKGTKRLNAKDIAVEIDSLGGELNAFTSRELTTFYVKVLDDFLEKGIDLLSDIFINSTFPEIDIEREKKVVREEIKMVEDTPDDYVHDLFNQHIWGNQGLGQSILGGRETIRGFTRNDLISHIRKYYGTKDILISCTGNFDHGKLMSLLEKNLGHLRRGSEPDRSVTPTFQNGINVVSKDLAEAHLCMGVRALPQSSKERYVLFLLNTIFGSSVSSRLFQEVREKRGLAYAIYSFIASYFDTGVWGVYAGVSRKNIREVIALILKEITSLKDTIDDAELQRAKDHLKGNMILGLESTSGRMNNIARQEIYYGKYYSPREIINLIDAVTLTQVKGLADALVRKEFFACTVYGSVDKNEISGIL